MEELGDKNFIYSPNVYGAPNLYGAPAMLHGDTAVNMIPNVTAFLEIIHWAGSEIKIMQFNKCIHRESPGNGAMRKIKVVS